MRAKLSVLFVIVLFSSVSFLFAQQDSKPARLLVMQDVVYPNKAEAYENAQKEMNEFISKNYPQVKWTCIQYDNYTYDYLVDLGDYGKIDEMNKMWADKMKTVNQDEFKKYADAFVGTISATHQFVVTQDNKGSYNAKDPFAKIGDSKFYHWDYFEFIPGKEDEALQVARDEAALAEKLNLKGSFHLWHMSMGQNTNSYIYVSWDKSRVDFFTNIEADNKVAGKQMEELDKKFMSYVQKFDHWNGKTRPELSINPANTANK
jgi:hypothetical protein